jgi:glycosyltransferase 2 family protein
VSRLTHKQKIQLLVGAALAVGLLAWFLHGQNWSEIGAAFRRAKPLPLVGLVVATTFSYLVRAWRWGYLYRPLAPIPFKDLLSATYVGFMSGQLVPRSGEVLRPYLIARKHPVSTSAGFATIILERLIDLITVVLLFALYLYVLPMPQEQSQGPIFQLLKRGGAFGALIGLVGVGVLVAFHSYPEKCMSMAERVLQPLPKRLAHPFQQLLKSFGDGLAVLKAPFGLWVAIAGQSLLLWLAIAYGFHLNNVAFGIELPMHTTFLLIAFLTVGVAIPTPGNVGGFHGAYLKAMSGAYGIPQETAMAAGISAHALTNLSILVLGLVFLAREGLTMGKVAELAGREKE